MFEPHPSPARWSPWNSPWELPWTSQKEVGLPSDFRVGSGAGFPASQAMAMQAKDTGKQKSFPGLHVHLPHFSDRESCQEITEPVPTSLMFSLPMDSCHRVGVNAYVLFPWNKVTR